MPIKRFLSSYSFGRLAKSQTGESAMDEKQKAIYEARARVIKALMCRSISGESFSATVVPSRDVMLANGED
jgi:hypothetical protein